MTVRDDAWRDPNYDSRKDDDYHCDHDILNLGGWYRFLIKGRNASIPTACVEPVSISNTKEHCTPREYYLAGRG